MESVTAIPARRMNEVEWQTRVHLAACYRLVDLFGWSDLVNTRITARVPGAHDNFLITPTASCSTRLPHPHWSKSTLTATRSSSQDPR